MSSLTVCIEDLPSEMIRELFEYLPPKHLAACSMVNRRWQSIYADFKLHRLVVTDHDYSLNKWKDTNQPIREAERCSLAMFRRLAEKPLLSDLKYLVLDDYDPKSDLKKLNRFRQLVHLEIYKIDFDKVNLNLPRLKVLAFHHKNKKCALSIGCPELSTLAYKARHVRLLDVKQPETIKSLETNLVDPEWLAQFKSVECLITKQFEAISKATLQSLESLRELRFNGDIENLTNRLFERVTIDQVKRTVSEFVDEAKRLGGSDFRFTFAGLQLTNVNQIDFGVQVNEGGHYEWVYNDYIYMKNYHLIKPGALQFIRQVDYTRLMSVTGEFPRCFFQKFTDIKEVRAMAKVQDPDHLLWFLKSLRSPRRLDLGEEVQSQEFYDQLPASAPSLAILGFHVKLRQITVGVPTKPLKELHLNFDFIRKFRRITMLDIIEQPISLESLASIMRSSATLVVPRFYVRLTENDKHWIQREWNSKVWKITDFRGELLFEAENPDEIINFLEGLRT